MVQAKNSTDGNADETELMSPENAETAGASGRADAEEERTKSQSAGKSSAAASAKKALGTKEPIPFAWKLIGTSGDVVLTLFKAVDRAEVEAQLARLLKEGYYSDLKILENDAKVMQPKASKPDEADTRSGAGAGRAKRQTPGRTRRVTGKTSRAASKASEGVDNPKSAGSAPKRSPSPPGSKRKKAAKKK